MTPSSGVRMVRIRSDSLYRVSFNTSPCVMILELRHMVEQALWPYVNQATCLVADLDDIEKEPTIYNFLTHEVYENDTWIHREIDLRWKLLVHLTPEQRESVPPANHSMNGGIYHEMRELSI